MANAQVNLRLYRYYGDERVVCKTTELLDGLSTYGNFRLPLDISNPVIEFYKEPRNPVTGATKETEFNYNYLYIPSFDRYYYINEVEVVGNYIYRLYCSVDVLMSFYKYILYQSGYVLRNQHEFNDFLVDDEIPSRRTYNTKIIPFGKPRMHDVGEFDFEYNYSFVLNCISDSAKVVDASGGQINKTPTINEFNTVYIIDSYSLNTVIKSLLDDSFINNLSNFFADKSQSMYSLYYTPFNYSKYLSGTTHFNYRGYESKINLANGSITLSEGHNAFNLYQSFVGRFYWEIPETIEREGFFDIEPYTTYEIYLPFYGIVTINSHYLSKTKTIVYDFDPTTGSCRISFSDATSSELDGLDGNVLSVNSFLTLKCNIYTEIPIGSTNKVDIQRNLLSLGLETGIGLISAGVGVGAGISKGLSMRTPKRGLLSAKGKRTIQSSIDAGRKEVGNIAKSTVHSTLSSASDFIPSVKSSGFSGELTNITRGAKSPYIIKTQPFFYHPDNYNSLFGRPLCQTRPLNRVYGFTVVDEIKYKNPKIINDRPNLSLNVPYQNELEIINQFLTNGVYLLENKIIENNTLAVKGIIDGGVKEFSINIRFYTADESEWNGIRLERVSGIGNIYSLDYLTTENRWETIASGSVQYGFLVDDELRELTFLETKTIPVEDLNAFRNIIESDDEFLGMFFSSINIFE